jgi:hypothetical protein
MAPRTWLLVLLAAGGVLLVGTAAPARATNARDAYYLISATDGSLKIERMSTEDARDLGKQNREAYREAAKTWLEQKQDWEKAVGAKPFPVPRPQQIRLRRLGHVGGRKDEEERHARQLEVWNVCLISDCRGAKSISVIRDDKMRQKQIELMKEYVDAVKEYVARVKQDPEVAKDPEAKPKGPVVKALRRAMRDSEKADKLAELYERKLQKQLDAAKDKEAKTQ